jgi:hypothetical protein
MGRRAALWTTLITGASIAGKADVSPVHSLSADARRTVDGAMLLRACARDHAHACTCTRARRLDTARTDARTRAHYRQRAST